jgi:hypothetical protein
MHGAPSPVPELCGSEHCSLISLLKAKKTASRMAGVAEFLVLRTQPREKTAKVLADIGCSDGC